MIRIFSYLFILGLSAAQNNYPIVLIPGFMGWGPNEMGGYNYWGGKKDYIEMMEEKGYHVIELSVGPISSNWERAVEAYYQLIGGQVDYGLAHAKKFNVVRKPKGKYYEGLYPEWDSNNPIHIIGYSMGGQTARMLDFLLKNQIFVDGDSIKKEESELMGNVHKNMIKSITSISTPHNGTTLTEIVVKTIPFIQYFVGVAGVIGTDFFDFDLDQFEFKRKKNESWSIYINRMKKHEAWNTKNICSWDLSLEGAKELNSFLNSSSDIYYFSFVTSTTKRKEDSQFHSPEDGTSILIKTRSKLMGARPGYWGNGVQTDSSWFENDGIVNSTSMYSPQVGIEEPNPIIPYNQNSSLIPGAWYWIKVDKMDHWSIIGHLGSPTRLLRAETIFFDHLNRLKALPL